MPDLPSAGRLPDAQARLTALTDHDRTLLVEAGAGSGKTSLLAGRVALLIAAGVHPKEIVAITFEPPPRQGLKREVLEMRIVIKPVGDDRPLTLSVSANLGG